ncbi:MAG: hypothetical protein ACOX3A_09825 [bacterium]|jgi:hypothetical protein
MWELVLIYVFLVLLPRMLKGVAEGQRTAPRKRQPQPYAPAGDLEEVFSQEKSRIPREWENAFPLPHRYGDGSRRAGKATEGSLSKRAARELEFQQQVAKTEAKEPDAPPVCRLQTTATKGLFSRPESWAHGIIMAEVLSPPRSLRPWQKK